MHTLRNGSGDATGTRFILERENNSPRYYGIPANNNQIHTVMRKCSRKCCLCCKNMNKINAVKSCSTGTSYINPEAQTFTCTDTNLVYLIECKKCSFQYVGETIQLLKERFLQHRGDARRNVKSTYLVQHFNSDGHTHNDITISVLEGLKTSHDPDTIKTSLREIENKWILALNTAYPFGMNDNVKTFGNVSSWNSTVATFESTVPYFQVKNSTTRKRSTHKKKRNKMLDLEFHIKVASLYKNQEYRKLYIYLKGSTKRTIKKSISLLYSINAPVDVKLVILGYYAGNFLQKIDKTNKKETDKIIIPFVNKSMDNVYLQKIINKTVSRILLDNVEVANDRKKATIVYKYDVSIGQQIFNYNKMFENKTLQDLKFIATNPCNCQSFDIKYVNQDFKHIITTDYTVLNSKHKTLDCNLLSHGTNHRIEQPQLNTSKLEMIMNNLETYAAKVAIRYNIDNKTEKIAEYCKIVKQYINKMIKYGHNNEINNVKLIKNEISKLALVCTSVDKACNNFAFICQKWYISCLMKELGVETYNPVNVNENSIVARHNDIMSVMFGLVPTNDENNVVPKLYGLVKLHKKPVKFRYIAGASKSSTKPAAKMLHKILSYLKNHFQKYCNIIEKRSNVKIYISVDNSMKVINNYNQNITKIKDITAYDFSTLYTKLPHETVISNMTKLVELLFGHAKAKGINVSTTDYGNAYYEKSDNNMANTNNRIIFSKEQVISMIEFIVKESYIRVGNSIFRQKAGVPQGGNASPMIADLTLSYMEFIYLKSAKPFKRKALLCRYIDDILVINEKFDKHTAKMYPKELVLNADKGKNNKLNYLDITFDVITGSTKVYNKTDVFEFTVNRAYDATSCVSSRMLNGIIIGQILRFNRITAELQDFKQSILQYFLILIKKRHPLIDIVRSFTKYCRRYENKLWKYKMLDNKTVTKKLIIPIVNKLQ